MDIEAKDNRGRILDTALSLFYEKGYDAVSVQNIVNAVGITKPTLYYYFGSKQGLLQALVDENSGIMLERLQGEDVIDKDVKMTLMKVAEVFVRYALERPKFYYYMLAMMYSARSGEPYAIAAPWLERIDARLFAIFDVWSGSLGNMNGRQKQFARSYFGFLNLYLYGIREEIESKKMLDVDYRAIEGIVHQFMYGIVV